MPFINISFIQTKLDKWLNFEKEKYDRKKFFFLVKKAEFYIDSDLVVVLLTYISPRAWIRICVEKNADPKLSLTYTGTGTACS
jgi:hypothetical protein